jgi:hypothetical protein
MARPGIKRADRSRSKRLGRHRVIGLLVAGRHPIAEEADFGSLGRTNAERHAAVRLNLRRNKIVRPRRLRECRCHGEKNEEEKWFHNSCSPERRSSQCHSGMAHRCKRRKNRNTAFGMNAALLSVRLVKAATGFLQSLIREDKRSPSKTVSSSGKHFQGSANSPKRSKSGKICAR